MYILNFYKAMIKILREGRSIKFHNIQSSKMPQRQIYLIIGHNIESQELKCTIIKKHLREFVLSII